MGKTLIKWQLNTQLIPVDPKQRFEAWMKMMEMVKADLESGTLTSWGIYSDARALASAHRHRPHPDAVRRLIGDAVLLQQILLRRRYGVR